MPKKLTKGEVEIWKKLREEEGLTFAGIGKQRGWSRQVVARELGKLEPKKPPEIPAIPTQDPLSYLNAMGSILRRKCPLGKRMRDGYCERAEFPAEDWELSDFKKIFPDFIMVERGGGRYLRPRIPLWYCYECAGMKLVEDKIIRVKDSLQASLREKSSELNAGMERIRKDLLNYMGNVRSELLRETEKLNRQTGAVEVTLNILRAIGYYYLQTCAMVISGYCVAWEKHGCPIRPNPYRCVTCKFYRPRG